MQWVMFAIISAVIFGLENIIKKKVLKKEHTLEFLTILYVVTFLILLPFYFKVNYNLSLELLFLIIFRSVLMLIAMVSFTKALKHLPISTALPLSNFKLIFALVFGVIILTETIAFYQILGILIIFSGSYILESGRDIKSYRKPLEDLIKSKYIHYIFIFSISASLSAVLSKIVLQHTDSFSLLFYHSFFSVIMYLLITFIFYNGISDLKECWNLAGIWMLLIAIFGIGASYTRFLAYESIGSNVAIIVPIIQLSTLIDVVLGGQLFKEKHIAIKSFACILMIFGVLLLLI